MKYTLCFLFFLCLPIVHSHSKEKKEAQTTLKKLLARNLTKEVNNSVNPPSQEKNQEKCKDDIRDSNQALQMQEILEQNYAKLDGDPIALSQALCFYKKNFTSTFERAGSIKNRRYIAINDLNKSTTTARLFILDLETGKVKAYFSSHGSGQKNDTKFGDFFILKETSNEKNSAKTPRGFFMTADTYSGNYGYSLRLHGLQRTINDNSLDRKIVIHGFKDMIESVASSDDSNPVLNSLYVPKDQDWGLALSQGCTMLAPKQATEVINMIKNGAVYYNYFKDEKEKGAAYCGDDQLMVTGRKAAPAKVYSSPRPTLKIDPPESSQTRPQSIALSDRTKGSDKKKNVKKKNITSVQAEKIDQKTEETSPVQEPPQVTLDSKQNEKFKEVYDSESRTYFCYNVDENGRPSKMTVIENCLAGYFSQYDSDSESYLCYPKSKNGRKLGTSTVDIKYCQEGFITAKNYYGQTACYPKARDRNNKLGTETVAYKNCQDPNDNYIVAYNYDSEYYACYPKSKDKKSAITSQEVPIGNCQEGYISKYNSDTESYLCYPKSKDGKQLGTSTVDLKNCQEGFIKKYNNDAYYCYRKSIEGYALGNAYVDMSNCEKQ